MKKQNKILLGILAVLVIGAAIFVSTNPNLFQGRLSRDRAINRAEFARMLVASAELETAPCETFTDVPLDVWFNEYVCTLASGGLMAAYPDGTFRPSGLITRAEAARIIYGAFNVEYNDIFAKKSRFRDVSADAWYALYINQLAALGFFDREISIRTTNFRPSAPLTVNTAERWFYRADTLR